MQILPGSFVREMEYQGEDQRMHRGNRPLATSRGKRKKNARSQEEKEDKHIERHVNVPHGSNIYYILHFSPKGAETSDSSSYRK